MTPENCVAIHPRISMHQDVVLPQILSSANLDGRIFLFARGKDGQLWFTTRDEGAWTLKWNTTGQQTQSQPASIVWGTPKRLSIFYVRDDNMVMTGSLQDGTWGLWEALGAKVSSPPVICHEVRSDIIHVWARDNTGAKLIVHNYWEAGPDYWHTLSPDWEVSINAGAARAARSTPAVVCRNSSVSNDVVIYDKDLSSALHKQWNTTRNRWGPWQDLKGSYAGDPVLVSPSDDRIDFFGISNTGRALTHISRNGTSNNTSPYMLQGALTSVPSVAVTSSSRLDVFALSINGTINHRALLGSTWSPGWSDLGISAASAPLATLLDTQPPRILLQVLGSGADVLNSEWEVTDNGRLKNVVPIKSIGGSLSSSWMVTD